MGRLRRGRRRFPGRGAWSAICAALAGRAPAGCDWGRSSNPLASSQDAKGLLLRPQSHPTDAVACVGRAVGCRGLAGGAGITMVVAMQLARLSEGAAPAGHRGAGQAPCPRARARIRRRSHPSCQ